MNFLKKYGWVLGIVILFLVADGYLMIHDNYLLNAVPLALIVVYAALFYPEKTFLFVVFCTPLSISTIEFSDTNLGLFIPTEPILIGLLFLLLFQQLKTPFLKKDFWRQPITITIGFYLVWLFITSITSTMPVTSFKFLFMRLWYIIPIFLIGYTLFQKKKNIVLLLWCYAIPMTLVICYTLIHHSMYAFGEDQAYWVMSPFFKDHTIYGAGVALNLLFVIALMVYKKNLFQVQSILMFMLIITGVGLFFSYTRGAWISVIGAFIIWLLIKYKVKFKYLFVIGVVITSVVLFSWPEIQMKLDNNSHEHTAKTFEGRLISSSNISSDASNLERINRWVAAVNMFEERPVFGFGPATYAFKYAAYQDPEHLTVISTFFGNLGNAHSEYLGPLAETGLIGALSFIFFVAALFYTGITLLIDIQRYTPEDKELYRLILCLVLAMSTYFIHGLINDYLDSDKVAVPIFATAIIFIVQKMKLNKKRLKLN